MEKKKKLTKPLKDKNKRKLKVSANADPKSSPLEKREARKPGKNNLEPDPVAVAISVMDPNTRALLDLIYLKGMTVEQACIEVGVKYYLSKSHIKRTAQARPYILWLLDRQKVIKEFGVDDIQLVELVKIRNKAHELGNSAAAVRAHELCMRAVGRLQKEEAKTKERKPVNEMTREEIIEEILKIKMRADGQVTEKENDFVDVEYEELSQSMLPATTPTQTPNEIGRLLNES